MGEDQYSMTARSMEKLASSLHLSKESVNSNWASVNESHSAHIYLGCHTVKSGTCNIMLTVQ